MSFVSLGTKAEAVEADRKHRVQTQGQTVQRRYTEHHGLPKFMIPIITWNKILSLVPTVRKCLIVLTPD